jgi:hypothetical protein
MRLRCRTSPIGSRGCQKARILLHAQPHHCAPPPHVTQTRHTHTRQQQEQDMTHDSTNTRHTKLYSHICEFVFCGGVGARSRRSPMPAAVGGGGQACPMAGGRGGPRGRGAWRRLFARLGIGGERVSCAMRDACYCVIAHRISQFADDTTIFARHYDDACHIWPILDLYEAATGMRANATNN